MESSDSDEDTVQTLLRADTFKTTHKVELKMQWIPGHTDLYGNDRADILAKQGSNKTQPPKATTLKTTKQIIKQKYKENWMKDWTSGTTGRKVYKYMNTLKPSDDMRKLKRKDQTAIFRLRTEHVPFNLHLNRFNPAIPPLCALCDFRYETVEHVLFHCRELGDLRQKYLPKDPDIENTLYCSYHQLEKTANFFHMTCARRANAQRPLD